MRNCTKVEKLTTLTWQSIRLGPVDRFVRTSELNTLLHFIFSHVSSGSSKVVSIQLPMSDFLGH